MRKEKLFPPLLLTTHGPESGNQSFYNLSENRYHTTSIPVLRNKFVLCSAFGWLVLLDRTKGSNSNGQCCLWNPTSMEIIKLPLIENPFSFINCFLSKPPTDPDCFILFNNVRSYSHILYIIRDKATFKINLALEDYILMSMVSFQGTIYGLIQPLYKSKYEFVTVHMVGDKIETKPLLIDENLPWEVPQGIRSWNAWNHVYLMESPCGNELLLVIKMTFNVDVESAIHFRVFGVDVGKMECEELDNIDGRSIFIGYFGNGFCRSSESFGTTIKPNSIHYTFYKCSDVYVYDLDDRSMTTLSPYPDSVNKGSYKESSYNDSNFAALASISEQRKSHYRNDSSENNVTVKITLFEHYNKCILTVFSAIVED